MTKYWIGVACRQHVRNGMEQGICQVCHGKPGPLKRMQAGDWIAYYSPTEVFGEKVPVRKFTAIGRIREGEPYQVQMSPAFVPWRRDVDFCPANDAPIEPMLEDLSFIVDKRRWGFPFRRGCFTIALPDFKVIAQAMGVAVD